MPVALSSISIIEKKTGVNNNKGVVCKKGFHCVVVAIYTRCAVQKAALHTHEEGRTHASGIFMQTKWLGLASEETPALILRRLTWPVFLWQTQIDTCTVGLGCFSWSDRCSSYTLFSTEFGIQGANAVYSWNDEYHLIIMLKCSMLNMMKQNSTVFVELSCWDA